MNPKLKVQLEYYSLSLDDVGITYWNKDYTKRFKESSAADRGSG